MSELPRAKILVVDDLEENLIALRALLRDDDLELVEARSGPEALEALLAHEFALAIVDVQMPDMDGFELAELMRGSERTRNIPIIFLTAGAHDAIRVFRGYDAGAIDFLFKPLDPRILRHKIVIFVELDRQRRLLAEQNAQLRRSETEARRLRDELAANLRLVETFVAAIGHDLRNPLNAILMAADLLAKRVRDEDATRLVERLRSSGRRIRGMIDELFDLARVRLGEGIPIHAGDVDLQPLAEKVVGELRIASRDRVFELVTHGDSRGAWDGDRLEQVISNLVANAVRYGSRDAPITISIDGRDPTRVSFAVTNGGEIPSDVRAHMFDPFRRAYEHRTSEGLGLGLFIVRHLVEAHDGTIEVASGDGRTTFCVVLPRRARVHATAISDSR